MDILAQIMISVFNLVKSNNTDEQVQEWNNNRHPFLIVKIKSAFIYGIYKASQFSTADSLEHLNIFLFEYL